MPREGGTRAPGRRPWRRALVAVAVASVGMVATVPVAAQGREARTGAGSPPPGSPSTRSDWTVYHGAPDGAGVAHGPGALTSPERAWRSRPLDGAVYGEPLEAAGLVVVATESDTVYALAASSGTVRWSTQLGHPVPSRDLPCGNITPSVGVTGTPVIDLVRSEVFLVADELVGGNPQHRLVGLDLHTGRVRLDRRVDPPRTDAAALLQRTGLTLDRGRVVFGFGGNYGDCGRYHGWLVSVPVKGTGRVRRYETATRPGDRQGAIWMGGAAPEVGPRGDLLIATGNSSAVSGSPDGSDSVVELSPSLHRVGIFTPRAWGADNAGDRDLGSTAPALLPGGDILQVGKSGTAYLLRRDRLGGVGGQTASAPACNGSAAGGGDAVRGHVVYVACVAGLEALATSASSVTVRWDAGRTAAATGPSADGTPHGPPIIAGGLVWSVGGTSLFGLDPASGAVVVRLVIGSNANDFPTPSAAGGLLVVAGGNLGNAVLAFSGTGGTPPAPAAAPR